MDYMQYKDSMEFIEHKVEGELKAAVVVFSTVTAAKIYECSIVMKNLITTMWNGLRILDGNNLEMKLVQDAINSILDGLEEIQNIQIPN